jgi:hypothetical protein
VSHDFDAQRAETQATYDALSAEHTLPETADLDYFLIPNSDEADWRPLADILTRQGFECQWIEEDGDPYLVATLRDQAVSSTGIWIGEEVATRAALDHGFAPDGGGMES